MPESANTSCHPEQAVFAPRRACPEPTGEGTWASRAGELALRERKRPKGAFGSHPYSGFTLLELMIVISIMLILMAVALPIYNQSIVRSREAVLRQDLFQLRSLISQ